MDPRATRNILLNMDDETLYNAVMASPVFRNIAMNDPLLTQRVYNERFRRQRRDNHIRNNVPM